MKATDKKQLSLLKYELECAWEHLKQVEDGLESVEDLEGMLDDEHEEIQDLTARLDDVIQAFESVLSSAELDAQRKAPKEVPKEDVTHRVIQQTEMGEELYCFSGSKGECTGWVVRNAGNFPESTFFVEEVD